MVDLLAEDPRPYQSPTLSEPEEARVSVQLARHVVLEAMMAAEDVPDVEVLLAELVNRPAWHQAAACRGTDPEQFFPESGGHRPDAALAYCAECVVRSECLAVCLELARTPGVWGGTTALERRARRRGVA
jgi:WhiB family redox-sensing transcriptional regulator